MSNKEFDEFERADDQNDEKREAMFDALRKDGELYAFDEEDRLARLVEREMVDLL